MKFIAIAVGILTLVAADGPFRLTLDHNLAATAAAAENAGRAGIEGNPQKKRRGLGFAEDQFEHQRKQNSRQALRQRPPCA